MSAKVEFEGKKYRVNGIEMNVVIEGQGQVRVAVMGVWGEDDVALVEEQMIASEKYVSASWRHERIGDRSDHWLMLSAPDKFNAVLLDYLKADVGAKPRANSSSH